MDITIPSINSVFKLKTNKLKIELIKNRVITEFLSYNGSSLAIDHVIDYLSWIIIQAKPYELKIYSLVQVVRNKNNKIYLLKVYNKYYTNKNIYLYL